MVDLMNDHDRILRGDIRAQAETTLHILDALNSTVQELNGLICRGEQDAAMEEQKLDLKMAVAEIKYRQLSWIVAQLVRLQRKLQLIIYIIPERYQRVCLPKWRTLRNTRTSKNLQYRSGYKRSFTNVFE